MNDPSLGRVVGSLQLRDVNNVSTHARGCHEAAVSEALELVAIGVRSLLLLASPVSASGSCAIEGAVQVGGHNLAVVIDLPVEHGTLCPWDPGVGDEDV